MSITKNIIIDENKGLEADTHKVQSVKIDRGKVLVFVESFKAGYTSPIAEKWFTLTEEEFNAAEPTTEHDNAADVIRSRAYVAFNAKYFTEPELEEEQAEELDDTVVPAE